ncbi:hypothetical protein WAB17_10555 [Parerythrobacter aurantius]|uniref:hypothetical protein n=1 Tax=Parerythrobacter aurantius TaxID=3127706 RepID=UPI003251FE2F
MKTFVAGTLGVLSMASFAAAAATAQPAEPAAPTVKVKAEVVERNARGQATKVRIGDTVVEVCLNESMTDGCINPREAGLNWGNRPAATYRPDAN